MSTLETIHQFNDAFNRHDVEAIMAAMTEDCVFENTYPPPDGERYEGQAAVRTFWEEFFRFSSDQTFEIEEAIGFGDRGILRWRYCWTEADGEVGHMRGVDLYRLRDGKVAEKLSYVKG